MTHTIPWQPATVQPPARTELLVCRGGNGWIYMAFWDHALGVFRQNNDEDNEVLEDITHWVALRDALPGDVAAGAHECVTLRGEMCGLVVDIVNARLAQREARS